MAAIQWRTGDGNAGSMNDDDKADTIGPVSSSTPNLVQLKTTTLPVHSIHQSSGDLAESDSTPKNNNSATHYGTLPPANTKVQSTIRHSFRCSVKRRSMKLLKNIKAKPHHLKMSSHTKHRNIANFARYSLPAEYCASSCIIDTDDIDKGEVIFFSYSDDGLSYTKEAVPICNAGCLKHRIRRKTDCDDDEESHGEDYDSGGEFGDCDENQVEEVLADYTLKEAPVHVSTIGRLPPSHSFEAMSDKDFTSSFAYCDTERLSTIRRSTIRRKSKPTPSTTSTASISSTSSRKSRFVASVNKKMTSKAWPLRSLWLFLTRQKDDSHRSRMEDYGETMESATRYIRVASHFESASVNVHLVLQTVQGASPVLRSIQTDLISTALKAFFTMDENIDITWVDDVPREIQKQLAIGNARVHFSVPDIRQCVACLLASPDATILLRRPQCILLKSIAEVLECREECLVVMQTKEGVTDSLSRHTTSNGVPASRRRISSSQPSPPTMQ